jgi:sensor c-di-GMP phosphodiesterase-like protein
MDKSFWRSAMERSFRAPTIQTRLARTSSISTFSAASARYPVLLSIKIDGQALSQWNKEPRPLAPGVGALFGALFGLLVLEVMSKPSDPVRDIDRALARREFEPFMQPIFSMQTGEIVGCEVLARWVRRDGTLVSPCQFIPPSLSSRVRCRPHECGKREAVRIGALRLS